MKLEKTQTELKNQLKKTQIEATFKKLLRKTKIWPKKEPKLLNKLKKESEIFFFK